MLRLEARAAQEVVDQSHRCGVTSGVAPTLGLFDDSPSGLVVFPLLFDFPGQPSQEGRVFAFGLGELCRELRIGQGLPAIALPDSLPCGFAERRGDLLAACNDVAMGLLRSLQQQPGRFTQTPEFEPPAGLQNGLRRQHSRTTSW